MCCQVSLLGIDTSPESANMNLDMKDILTIKEVAELLGVNRSTVYEFINDKKNPLPTFHLGSQSRRIRRSDLDAWVDVRVKVDLDILYTKGLKGGGK